MRLHLLCVGTRLPAWAEDAVHEYSRRMPPECRLEVRTVAAAPRGRRPDVERIRRSEAAALEKALPKGVRLVIFDERGRTVSTRQLAALLGGWMEQGGDVCLLIGGADGLDPDLQRRAESSLSLSALTLPHALARVVAVEALYRAWTLHSGHPYHRE